MKTGEALASFVPAPLGDITLRRFYGGEIRPTESDPALQVGASGRGAVRDRLKQPSWSGYAASTAEPAVRDRTEASADEIFEPRLGYFPFAG